MKKILFCFCITSCFTFAQAMQPMSHEQIDTMSSEQIEMILGVLEFSLQESKLLENKILQSVSDNNNLSLTLEQQKKIADMEKFRNEFPIFNKTLRNILERRDLLTRKRSYLNNSKKTTSVVSPIGSTNGSDPSSSTARKKATSIVGMNYTTPLLITGALALVAGVFAWFYPKKNNTKNSDDTTKNESEVQH